MMTSATYPAPAQPSRWERMAIGSGSAFAAFQLGAILFAMMVVVPTHAPINAPPAETARALADNATLIAIGTYLFMLPMPLLLVFLGGLFAKLRRVEGGSDALAGATLAAGIAAAVIGPFGALLSGLTAPLALSGGDVAVVTALDSITPLAMALAAFPHAVLLATTSAAVLQSGMVSRRIAHIGLVLALVALISTGTMAYQGLFPLTALEMLFFPLWILTLSIALTRRTFPVRHPGPQIALG